jgi:hypothetical protein
MLLPKQTAPVRVSPQPSTFVDDAKSLVPQVSCYCRPNSTGSSDGTWYCIIGRDLWNTQQPCTV